MVGVTILPEMWVAWKFWWHNSYTLLLLMCSCDYLLIMQTGVMANILSRHPPSHFTPATLKQHIISKWVYALYYCNSYWYDAIIVLGKKGMHCSLAATWCIVSYSCIDTHAHMHCVHCIRTHTPHTHADKNLYSQIGDPRIIIIMLQ